MDDRLTKTILAVAAAGVLAMASAVPAAAKPQSLTINSGSTGGSWYPIGAGLAKIFADAGVSANAEVGNSLSNIMNISAGKGDISFTMSNATFMAKEGTPPFKSPITNVRGIAVVFPNVQHILVRKDAGIKTLADLKGKKFATSTIGSSTQEAFAETLRVFGLKEGDLTIARGSVSFGASRVKDRNAVGFTALTSAPNGTVTELMSTGEATLLSIGEAEAAKLSAINPGYVRAIIPTTMYPNLDKDVGTISSDTILLVNEAMSDDDAYWITKTLIDGLDSLRKIHASIRGLTPESMAAVSGVDLHPGAKKAYQEAGALK